MKVTILIATRNRPEMIEPCILSILNNTYQDFEFLIVDQSTDKGTEQIVKKSIQTDNRIRYLHMEGKGKCRALNLGIRSSSGDIIITTDDDCISSKDWIEKVVEAFRENPDVDIVYGKVINKPDEFWIKDRKYSGRLSKILFAGDGANRSMRRSVFEKLKGFDEFLGPGGPLMAYEDQDFAYRALKHGLKILNTTQAAVAHTPEAFVSLQERISCLKSENVAIGAIFSKAIRTLEWPAILYHFLGQVKEVENITKYIISRKNSELNNPHILLILQAWVLIAYWEFLGMMMAMRYSINMPCGLFVLR